MINAALTLTIAGLGFAAGAGLYDSLRLRHRKPLRHALTIAAWLLSLWVYVSHVGS